MSLKFLIVDDSHAMQTIVKRILIQAGYENNEFKFASNGREALKVMTEWLPDLVLLDWHMPEMTGIELLRHISQLDLDLKVGLVTAERSKKALETARDVGAKFIINKPFTVDTLKEALIPVLAGVSTIEDELDAFKNSSIIFPSNTALSKIFSVICDQSVRVEEVDRKPVSSLKMPCTLALYADTNENIKTVEVLDSIAASLLANAIGKTSQLEAKGENKLSLLNMALKLTSACLYNIEAQTDLNLLRSHQLSKSIKKLKELDNFAINERIDFEITMESGETGHILFCLEKN